MIPKVKHLIQYLSQFDPETEIHLDKDGWMVGWLNPKDEIDLIDKRGLFTYFEGDLIINN